MTCSHQPLLKSQLMTSQMICSTETKPGTQWRFGGHLCKDLVFVCLA